MASQDRGDLVFQPGTEVEVLNRFDGRWSSAFEVAGHAPDGYQLRRRSDGHVLPQVFPPDGVRPVR